MDPTRVWVAVVFERRPMTMMMYQSTAGRDPPVVARQAARIGFGPRAFSKTAARTLFMNIITVVIIVIIIYLGSSYPFNQRICQPDGSDGRRLRSLHTMRVRRIHYNEALEIEPLCSAI